MGGLDALAPTLALAGAVLGFIAVIGCVTLFVRFQRFARPYEELARAAASEGSSAALQAHLLGVERNAESITSTRAYAQKIETQLQTALQGVGFLKYDAFEDIRGAQSYSLCLLDAHRDGVVISSIAGRNDYRGYAKPVKHGTCDLAMSDEERQALEMAKSSLSQVTPATTARPAPEPEPANV